MATITNPLRQATVTRPNRFTPESGITLPRPLNPGNRGFWPFERETCVDTSTRLADAMDSYNPTVRIASAWQLFFAYAAYA